MDTCKKIQDLIVTDYADAQIDQQAKVMVDAHLSVCPDCRRLWEDIKMNTVDPFTKINPQPVPDQLWSMIKKRIETENSRQAESTNILARFSGLLTLPRLAAVGGCLALVIFGWGLVLNSQQSKEAREHEQVKYLVTLLAPADVLTDNELVVPQTSIEKYFL